MFRTLAAGVLLVPAVMVLASTLPLVALLAVPGLALLCYQRPLPAKKHKRRRAIITGGSSGIGLAVAERCVQRGDFAHVVILARNQERLETAKQQLIQLSERRNKSQTKTKIEALSVDVSQPEQLQEAATKIFAGADEDEEAETFTCLFCIAGFTFPEYFGKQPPSNFASTAQTNQLGTIYTVQAVLPHMSQGTLLFCSSMAGQVGTFGFTSYAPTKFAVRGFAEALHMELAATRPVSVCVAYPPDTDTPGYAVENQHKPVECQLISEAGGKPAHAADVAAVMVSEAVKTNPKFAIYFNFDAWMLASLTAGFAPVTQWTDALSQFAGMSLFRLISLFYLQSWHGTIRHHAQQRQEAKQD